MGRLLRCSPESNSTLFDCARCGLGQFGAITEARIRLRQVLPSVRTYTLLYEDVRVLMRDLEVLAGAQRFQYIDGWCLPVPRDLWQMASGQLFAHRVYEVYLSVEWDEGPPDQEEMLGDLHYTHLSGCSDYPTLGYRHPCGDEFLVLRSGGRLGQAGFRTGNAFQRLKVVR